MFNFLHTFVPGPVALTLGPVAIHWYGLLISIGAALGVVLATKLAGRYGIAKDHIVNLSFWAILFGIIGARIYYVLYAWEFYRENLLDIVKLWEGGIAIHGAIIAGIITIYVYCKRHNLSILRIADIAVVGVVVGQIIGRWGNYFNQELFGKPTGAPWGVPISAGLRPSGFTGEKYFHPTFLYESLLNIVVLGILLLLHRWYIKKPSQRGEGWITFIYLMSYSAIRFTMEFLRIDYSPVVFGVRWAQLLSGGIFITGLLFLILYFLVLQRRRTENANKKVSSADNSHK